MKYMPLREIRSVCGFALGVASWFVYSFIPIL